MADNSKDVALNLSVTSTGQQAITDLSAKVKDLAKQGGDAAPEFERLASELERLGQQSKAVDAVSKLGAEFDQAAAKQTELAGQTKVLGDNLDQLAEATRRAGTAEAEQRTELRRLQDALFDKQQALKTLKNDTDAAGKKTGEYKREVHDLTDAQIKLKGEIREQADVLRAAKAVTTEAEALERKAASAHRDSANALERANAAAIKQREALGVAKQALAETGLATNDLAEAQVRLQRSIEQVSFNAQVAEAKAAAAAEQAESDRLAQIVIANRNKMLAAAQDELAAQRRAERDAAADFERFQQRKVDAARKAAQQLDNAFASAGVRSLEAIQAEALGVERAMQLMAARFKQGEISADSLARGIAGARVRLQELHIEGARVPALKGQFEALSETISGIVNRFGALGATLGAIGYAFKPVVDAAVQLDSMRRALTAITGSSAEAERQIQFLSDTAKQAGVSAADLSESYVRFSASARASGISAKVVEDVFKSTALAAGNLGLSGDKVSHMLDALAQMANKGVVSMEELRQQLGDSLPGALSLMAKGLGLTEQELVKVVESGKLLTIDALPALAQALRSLGPAGGEVKGLSASFANLKNAATDAMRVFADSGFSEVITASLKVIATVLWPLIQGFTFLFDSIITGAKAAGVALGALATGDWKNLIPEMQRLMDGLAERQTRLADALQRASLLADDHARAQAGSGQATAAAGQQAAGATGQHAGNAAAHGQAAGAAGANATAQSAAGAGAAAAGNAAARASGNWVRLTEDFQKLNTETARQIELAEKNVNLKKVEGETAALMARAAGDEVAALAASATAALNNAEALGQLSTARQTELAALNAQLAALREYLRQHPDEVAAREKQVADLEAMVKVRTADAEKAQQAAELARSEASARITARQTYEDNAAALDQLREAYRGAALAAQTMAQAQREGFATAEQAAAAARNAAQAEALYRDALNDTVAAGDRKVAAIERNTNLTVRALQVQLEHQRTLEQEATLHGNSAQAIQARIAQKEIEIKIVKANIEAAKQEAAAILATAEAMKAELAALGQLTPEKQAEIDARIANAKAKQIEAQAGNEKIKQIELEIEAIRRAGQTQAATSSSNIEYIGRETDAVEDNTEAWNRNANARQAARTGAGGTPLDADGFVLGKDGNRFRAQGIDSNFVIEQLTGAGMSQDAAYAAARNAGLIDSNGRVVQGGYDSVFEAINAILKKLENPQSFGEAGRRSDYNDIPMFGQAGKAPAGGYGSAGFSPFGNHDGGAARTVNINLNGQTSTVGVTDDASVTALENLLKNLASAQKRSC